MTTITPYPSVTELYPVVKRNTKETLLGEGTAAIPSTTEAHLLDLVIQEGVATGALTTIGVTRESFTVLEKDPKTKSTTPYAVTVKGKSGTHNLYLVDSHNKKNELAVMIKDGKSILILSSRPFFSKQEASLHKVAGHTMYEWYKLSGDNFCMEECKIVPYSTSHGGGFDPASGYVSQAHTSPQEIAKGHQPIVSIKEKKGGAYIALIKSMKRENIMDGLAREVLVAPGVDPCLVICFVALLERHQNM